MQSLLENCSASDGGGGVVNENTLVISESAILNNSTHGGWGGGLSNTGTATLTNVTVSGNQRSGGGGPLSGGGAAIYTIGDPGFLGTGWVGELNLTNVTIVNNTDDDSLTDGIASYFASVQSGNSILNNAGIDCNATLNSNGNNLESGIDCGFDAPGDLQNTDALLFPLAGYGGPTPSHGIDTTSPAAEAGSNALCPATDQRGVTRPVDGDENMTATCDMGAYEYDPSIPIPSILGFAALSHTVNEDVGSTDIAVNRSGGTSGAVSIDYAIVVGSATAVDDYTVTSGTLNWGDGVSTAQTINIPIIDDSIAELYEDFTVELSNAQGGAVLWTGKHIASVRIRDNEAAEVHFTGTTTIATEPGYAQLGVIRLGDPAGDVSVLLGFTPISAGIVLDTDFTFESGLTVNWMDDQTGTQEVSLVILDDFDIEADETGTITLSDSGPAVVNAPSANTLTIQDSDNQPGTLGFESPSNAGGEADNFIDIVVIRTDGLLGEVTIDYATSDDTAIAGVNYTATSGQLVFTQGTDIDFISVPVIDNALYESDKTFTLTLSAPGGGASLGTSSTTVTIFNDDSPPAISMQADYYNAYEELEAVTISVVGSGSSPGGMSVEYYTGDDTAMAGLDYVANTGTLVWAEGETGVKSFDVAIINNEYTDGNRSFSVTLGNTTGTGVVLNYPDNAIVNINDNDNGNGAIRFTSNHYQVSEADGTLVIGVERYLGSTGEKEVQLVLDDTFTSTLGNASEPGHYTVASSAWVSWLDGEVGVKNITLNIVNNALTDGTREEGLTTVDWIGTSTLDPIPTYFSILDDDQVGSFTMASFNSVLESGPVINVPVSRIHGIQGAVSVAYNTSDVTAVADVDYTSTSGVLNWAAGDGADKIVTIPITNNAVFEPNRNFTLNLSTPTGGATIVNSIQTITIEDDDFSPGIVQFTAASYDVSELGGTVTIDVERTVGSDGDITISYATANGSATVGSGDYVPTSGNLIWLSGETGIRSFDVTILDDDFAEGTQTINLNLDIVAGGDGAGPQWTSQVNILDSDTVVLPGSIEFLDTMHTVTEGDGTALIDIVRSGGSDGVVSVTLNTIDDTATAPQDYAAISTSLVWGDGDSSTKQIAITIEDDLVVDGSDESVTLSLSLPQGGATLGTNQLSQLVIQDNDPQPQPGTLQFSAISYSVSETGTQVDLSVIRTGGSNGAVGVNFNSTDATAVSGYDYTGQNGTLSWADGDSAAKTITMQIIDDVLPENNEIFNVSLSAATGGADIGTITTATVTITPVNESPVSFDSALFANADEAVSNTLTASDPEGDVLTYSIVTQPGSGTLTLTAATGDFTFTPNAGYAGVDSFTFVANDGTNDSAAATVSLLFFSGTAGPPADPIPTNSAPSAPALIAPTEGASGVSADQATFQWYPSTDADGDTVSYEVVYCTDDTFAGCTPQAVAWFQTREFQVAGMGGAGMSLLLLSLLLGGNASRFRSKPAALLISALFLTALLLGGCSSGGGGGGTPAPTDTNTDPVIEGAVTHQVTGLTAATTYHWKVIANDGNGGITESVVRSFTTL